MSPPALNKAADEDSSSGASLSTCGRCQALDLKHMNPDYNSYVVLGRKLASFSLSCRICGMCRRIRGGYLNNFNYCLLCCFYTSSLFGVAVPWNQSISYRIEFTDGNSAPGNDRRACGSGGLHRFEKAKAMGTHTIHGFSTIKLILIYFANGSAFVQYTTKSVASQYGMAFGFPFAQSTVFVTR